MSQSSRRALFFAAGLGALLPGASPAAAVPRTYTIVIDKMKFGPLPAQLHKGDAIVWVNRDFLRHSATAADHSFDVDLKPGAKGKMILNKSGAIAFTCRYHPGMRGVLRVQ
jgi:plastocyanin